MKRPLILSDDLRDLIRHLPPSPSLKRKVRDVLDEITRNPHTGKALAGDLKDLWSYRIGKIRVIYRIQESSIALAAIGPRKNIYEKVALEIKRRLRD